MSDQPSEPEYSLLVPFLDQSPTYTYGVELGILFARMRRKLRNPLISGYYTIANQEQITLMANRLGWSIEKMEDWRHDENEPAQWFYVIMRKIGQ